MGLATTELKFNNEKAQKTRRADKTKTRDRTVQIISYILNETRDRTVQIISNPLAVSGYVNISKLVLIVSQNYAIVLQLNFHLSLSPLPPSSVLFSSSAVSRDLASLEPMIRQEGVVCKSELAFEIEFENLRN